MQAVLALALLALPIVTTSGQTPMASGTCARKAVDDALDKIENPWKPADDPRARLLGHPGWKDHLEALVDLVKVGPPAARYLKEAVTDGTPAKRAFVAQALALLNGPEAIRNALRDYDFSRMDSARVGRPAPDFTLIDDAGKRRRLERYRSQKGVVLVFLLEPR